MMCEQAVKVTQFVNIVTVLNCATQFTVVVKFIGRDAHLRPCSTDVAEIILLLQLETYFAKNQFVTRGLMGVWTILVICSHTAAYVRQHERPGDDGRSETERSDAEDGDVASQWYACSLHSTSFNPQ